MFIYFFHTFIFDFEIHTEMKKKIRGKPRIQFTKHRKRGSWLSISYFTRDLSLTNKIKAKEINLTYQPRFHAIGAQEYITYPYIIRK